MPDDPSLLPGPMLLAAGGTPSPELSRTSGRAAWSYYLRGRRARTRISVLVLPTTGGVVTVACTADEGYAFPVALDCEEALTSLQLTAAPLPPAPETAVRIVAPRTIARLDDVRKAARRVLASTRSPRRRAAAARRIASAYAAAARRLAPLARGATRRCRARSPRSRAITERWPWRAPGATRRPRAGRVARSTAANAGWPRSSPSCRSESGRGPRPFAGRVRPRGAVSQRAVRTDQRTGSDELG